MVDTGDSKSPVFTDVRVQVPDGPPISKCYKFAQIAQLVEQRTENPRVLGSIPSLGTIK